MKTALSWAVLALLLAATLGAVASFDRRAWPQLVGDEATYLMQAESLAWDGDLAYSRGDYDRFVAHWGEKPEGLILQSRDGGRTLTYAKPLSYSLFIAPFVRLSPTRGAAVANALLLAAAAIVAAVALARRLGPVAPLWVAAFLFASVAFASVLWAHADLFMMCLVAIALALAFWIGGRPERLDDLYSGPETEPARRFALRWAAAGALLAVVAAARPFYAALLLPAALAVPAARRRAGLAALATGAGVLLLAAVGSSLATRGTWTSYGGERQSFYGSTGFPAVDLPAGSWEARVAERGDDSDSWVKPQTLAMGFDARQTGWNVVYALVGRHVGVLPYFLPLLLGFVAYRPGEGRGALLVAVALAMACFLWVRPFNFYGGGGAIANRYFLPLYPAFWFLAARPVRGAVAVGAPLVAAALAAPFLWPLWTAPRAFPLDERHGYRWVSDAAQRLLPYETTLSHLKPSGTEDVLHNGLWLKSLSTSLRPEPDGARLHLGPEGEGALLLGSAAPLSAVRLDVAPPGLGADGLAIEGARITGTILRPNGGTGFHLELAGPRARHRMWWTDDPFYLYQLGLAVPGEHPAGITLRIVPEARAANGMMRAP